MAAPVSILEGLNRLAKLLVDDGTHLAVGTGTGTAVVGNTQLGEETHRVAVAQGINQGDTVQFRAVFSNSNLPTTVEEVGLFLNGTGSPNAGDMLVRALEQFTKGSADLLLVFEIKFS